MNFINALILGIVEGVTEFLPVSSTAHLIIGSKILGIPQTAFQTFFEVFIQSGAILAVVFLYFKYVLKNTGVIKNIIISFIPTAIVGLVLHKIIKTVFFESMTLISVSLLVIGLVFIIVESLIKNKKINLKKKIAEMTVSDALIIGVAQSAAVVPGVSRAGIVIIAMMLMGYLREESALYSFLLAVPTILAASALDLLKTDPRIISDTNNLLFIAVGFTVSFVTAYISVKWLVNFLKKRSLLPFGIYRIIIALLLFVI